MLKILYPSFCYVCRQVLSSDDFLCQSCKKKIIPVSTVSLEVTKKNFVPVYAASAYVDPLRLLVLKKNYSDRLAACALGTLACNFSGIRDFIALQQSTFDYIVPVPLHWTRYARRGFNQAYEMGRVLRRELDVPLVDCIARVRRTKFQSSLSSALRQKNVANVFKIRRKYRDVFSMMMQDKHVLVVDDLLTTGATLKNVVRVLLEGYPRSITVIVACRVTNAKTCEKKA